MFECVLNISEGRRSDVLDELSRASGAALRDRHVDPIHHRAVFTLIDEAGDLATATRALISRAFELIDLTSHEGVHPRLGVVDVVPFVALDVKERPLARDLRDQTATWVAERFEVPVFLYGPLADGTTRELPEIRRRAFRSLAPDLGPREVNERRGASALGERAVLVAWNLWLTGLDLEAGRELAKKLRDRHLRVLAFRVGDFLQISCNLVDPLIVTPSMVYDRVSTLLDGATIDHAELVGLAPAAVVNLESPARHVQLGLSTEDTIEARLG